MMMSFYNEHGHLFYLPFQYIIFSEKKYLEIASMETVKLQYGKPEVDGKNGIYYPQFGTFLLEVIDLRMDFQRKLNQITYLPH